MGWYTASDGPIRSKGTLYFVLHPHGLHMSGRWTGLGYDGRIMTGWAAMGQTQEEAEQAMARLISSEGATDTDGLPVRGRDHRALLLLCAPWARVAGWPNSRSLICGVRAEQGLAVVAAEQEDEPVQVLPQLHAIAISARWLTGYFATGS